ncbi:hypothetical protein F4779DRAFT_579502 [Xylariaceae sp. FL0662B]|nr:hypothetical protein F4779DRAFT_579502 [Xylariaceae sp. FL0662B]
MRYIACLGLRLLPPSFASLLPISCSVFVKSSTVEMMGLTALTESTKLPITFSAQLISLAGVVNSPQMSSSKLPLPLVLEHWLGGSDLSSMLLYSTSTWLVY